MRCTIYQKYIYISKSKFAYSLFEKIKKNISNILENNKKYTHIQTVMHNVTNTIKTEDFI